MSREGVPPLMDAYSVLLLLLQLKSSNGQKRVLLPKKKVHNIGFKQRGFIHEYDFY